MKKVLIEAKSFDEFRKEIKKNIGKNIIFSSDDDELNRKILEKEPVNTFLIRQIKRKDKTKQRNSGFNQVMAKIAKKKNVSIGIDLDEIISLHSKPKLQAQILARIKQNIKLCNKNKLKMSFITMQKRNLYDLRALGLVLGMPTWMTKSLES